MQEWRKLAFKPRGKVGNSEEALECEKNLCCISAFKYIVHCFLTCNVD